MRIVSQDGIIDVLYENFVFGITKDNSIVAIRDTVVRPSEVCHGIMAEYSTEAKAKKAMEILREQYTHMKRVECFSSSLGSNQLETLSHKEAELLGDEVQKLMCFQFPQDSEITE